MSSVDITSDCIISNRFTILSKESLNQFSSGAIGGIAGLVVGHPMETVKVLIQNSSGNPTFTDITKSIKRYGVARFFSGIAIPLYSYGFVNAVIFTSYKTSLHYLDATGTSSIANATAGAVSGLVQLIPCVPIEVIKTQQQTLTCSGYQPTTKELVKTILRVRGFAGLYEGACVQAMRDVPGFMTYFWSYSEIFKLFSTVGFSTISSAFVSGAIGGALSWCVSMPFDVIKTRQQSENGLSTISIISHLLKEKSYFGFFCGFKVAITRALLVNACTFAVYETTYNFLKN